MTIKETLAWANQKLKDKKTTSANLDAEILLSFVFKKPREYLYTYPEKNLTKLQLMRFKRLINRRAKCVPVAYLTQHKEFFGLDFYVNKNVLIPRPETEILVEETLKQINRLLRRSDYVPCEALREATLRGLIDSPINRLTLFDIGTGSGCIAVALAKDLSNVKIYATDISNKTLKVAKKNAKQHKVKITFLKGNLLKPLKNKKIDIIVANPPYLTKNELTNVPREPQKALYGGKEGLDVYVELFNQLAQRKQLPKLILIEIGYKQKDALIKTIKSYFPKSNIETKKDLAGKNRLLKIFISKTKGAQ